MTTYRRFDSFSFDRTICDVIYEIVEWQKRHNYTMLESQLEEIRMYAQRMEDKLWKYKQAGYSDDDFKELEEKRKQLKEEIFQLQAIKYNLKKEVPNAKKEEAPQTTPEAKT